MKNLNEILTCLCNDIVPSPRQTQEHPLSNFKGIYKMPVDTVFDVDVYPEHVFYAIKQSDMHEFKEIGYLWFHSKFVEATVEG